MLSGLAHAARSARAGFVLAREGALALIDPGSLPPAARGALRLARLLERPGADSVGAQHPTHGHAPLFSHFPERTRTLNSAQAD